MTTARQPMTHAELDAMAAHADVERGERHAAHDRICRSLVKQFGAADAFAVWVFEPGARFVDGLVHHAHTVDGRGFRTFVLTRSFVAYMIGGLPGAQPAEPQWAMLQSSLAGLDDERTPHGVVVMLFLVNARGETIYSVHHVHADVQDCACLAYPEATPQVNTPHTHAQH